MRPWLFATLFWMFLAVLYAAQLVYMANQPGERINLRTALIWNLSYYLCWIPLTPPVWFISRNWAAVATSAGALVGRHVPLAAAVVTVHAFASVLVATAFIPHHQIWATFVSQLRGRMIPGLLVYVAIAGTGVALSYYSRWRERELAAAQLEAELSDARLQSLKAQLHPHFLFNTLHAVASLIRTGDNAGAVRAIGSLSDLLRRVLDADARPRIPLSEEAAFLERYFEIQRMRFGNRLRTSIDLEPGTEDTEVPALLLQPLVENAFRHGLADRIEEGCIHVRASRTSTGALEIVVEDNGRGLPPGWRLEPERGVGLRNTEARLAQQYRHGYAFSLGPRAGGGTVATIRLPVVAGLEARTT